jgi:ferric iron reductase protein FhuF
MTIQTRLQQKILDDIITHFQQTVSDGYGNSILLSPPPDETNIIPAAQYLHPDRLLSIFKASREYEQTRDLRVAASLWNKGYSWTPLPNVLALMTYAGVGLDASLDNISYVFRDAEMQGLWFHDPNRVVIYPKRLRSVFGRESPLPIPKDCSIETVNSVDRLHQFVFTGLFQNHLTVIIDRLHALTKLSKKTMWGNAINASHGLFEDLQGSACPEAIQIDYATLFEQPYSAVMPGRNPLYNLLRTETLDEPGLPVEVTFRATCCLMALIPPDHKKCGNCPLLKPHERIAKLKKRLTVAN